MSQAPFLEDRFSIREARAIVKDLFKPNPRIYWTDFLVTISIAYGLFLLPPLLPWLMPEPVGLRVALQVVTFCICCLAYYRASMFIHELVHLPRDQFRRFYLVWNFLYGTKALLPACTYRTHLEHHRRKHYGTHQDGEYLAFEQLPKTALYLFILQPLFFPPVVFFRFFVLTPLTWFSPRIRDWVHSRASSLVIDLTYRRPLPSPKERRTMRIQEVQCFNGCLAIVVIMVLLFRSEYSFLALPIILHVYLLAICSILLNNIRTLGAHRFYGDESEMSFVEQLVDSVNYPCWPLISGLWAPVGLRFHALHHLFPSLPYHNLAEGHRRLMEQLPADSPYRRTEANSLLAVIWDLWQRSGAARRRRKSSEPANTQLPANSDETVSSPGQEMVKEHSG